MPQHDGMHNPCDAIVVLGAAVWPGEQFSPTPRRRTAHTVHCQHGWATALVVTDRYHLPRTLLAFRSLGIYPLGSIPQGSRYSRRRWKRWYYPIREGLPYVWYILLIVLCRAQRLSCLSCLTNR
jgi:hypothetical protein